MDNQAEIKDKIRKLLALSKSPNEHEAMRAMAKAIELMAKYNCTISDDPDPEHVPHKSVCFWRSMGVPTEAHILGMLVEQFRCTYTAEITNGCGVLVIFGNEDDINIAIDALRLAYSTFCSTWRAYFKTLPKKKQMKRDKLRIDYCFGFQQGFELYINSNNTEKGIVLVTSEAIINAPRAYERKWFADRGIVLS